MTTGYADSGDGKLYYEIEGKGEVLVLIHAGFVDSGMWEEQWESLPEITGFFALICAGLENPILQQDPFPADMTCTACFRSWELNMHIYWAVPWWRNGY